MIRTLRSSKSVFVRVFYGEKVEKEGRRELSIRDETSGDKLLKTLTKKKVSPDGYKNEGLLLFDGKQQ